MAAVGPSSAPLNQASRVLIRGQTTPSFHREPRTPGFYLTDRDLRLLGFASVQRFVLAKQVEAWLGASEVVAYRRLRGLVRAGLLAYERLFHNRPGCYRLTTAGLAVIESALPRPLIDLRCYRHDIGAVWLWLGAWQGDFGACARVLSERQMRSHDQQPDPFMGYDTFAIPLGGYGPGGRPRIHFPDVLVIGPDNRRLALELELTLKSRSRLNRIIAGYAAEPRIDRVVYLTDSRKVAQALTETSLSHCLEGRVLVHYLDQPLGRDARRPAYKPPMAGEIKR